MNSILMYTPGNTPSFSGNNNETPFWNSQEYNYMEEEKFPKDLSMSDLFKFSKEKNNVYISDIPIISLRSYRPYFFYYPLKYIVHVFLEYTYLLFLSIFRLIKMLNFMDWIFIGICNFIVWLFKDQNIGLDFGITGTFISLALFPITFTLGLSHGRKNKASGLIGSLNKNYFCLLLSFRNVCLYSSEINGNYRNDINFEFLLRFHKILKLTFRNIKNFVNISDRNNRSEILYDVYIRFNHIKIFIKYLSSKNLDSSYVTYLDSYVDNVIADFHGVKSIIESKTESSLLSFTKISVMMACIFYSISLSTLEGNSSEFYRYFLCCVFTWLMLTLYETHVQFELPLGDDIDDVHVNVALDTRRNINGLLDCRNEDLTINYHKVKEIYGYDAYGYEQQLTELLNI